MRYPLAALLVVTLLAVAGCRSAPGLHREGDTYYQWMQATPQQVADAAVRVGGQYDLHVISTERSAQSARVVTRNTYGALVSVTARPDGRNVSKVGVKVEPGADEGYSRQLLDAIRAAL